MNYTAAASWLILVAVAMFAASYLPRIAERVRNDRAVEARWKARLAYHHLAADITRAETRVWDVALDQAGAAAQLNAALDDAERVLDEAYTYIAAREAAQLDAEWKRAQG